MGCVRRTLPWRMATGYFSGRFVPLGQWVSGVPRQRALIVPRAHWGHCILYSFGRCFCEDGYTGLHCETDWDECWNEPCLNGGPCLDGIAHYNCSCPAGFSGSRCQTNVDDCLSDPCLNNGTCVDGVAGYLCNCQLGFRGDDCEIDIQVNQLGGKSKLEEENSRCAMLVEWRVRRDVQTVGSALTGWDRSSPASAAKAGRATPARTRFPAGKNEIFLSNCSGGRVCGGSLPQRRPLHRPAWRFLLLVPPHMDWPTL